MFRSAAICRAVRAPLCYPARVSAALNPRTLLEQHGLQPTRALGQHFLHDPGALQKIVASASLAPDETVLEVGAGTGTLTRALLGTAAQLLAVELDARLLPLLRAGLPADPRLRILHADILQLDLAALLAPRPWVVVANLPYYLTGAILRHLLACPHRPRRLVLTVQQEVAERLVARPGALGLLAVSVQFYGRPRILGRLKPAAFWPRPGVDSAILRVDVHRQSPLDVPDEATFFRVARAGFSQRRKQLRNALGSGLGIPPAAAADLLHAADIDPRRRAQTLALPEWAALARALAAADGEARGPRRPAP